MRKFQEQKEIIKREFLRKEYLPKYSWSQETDKTMNWIAYDLETKRGVPNKGEEPIEGIEYCEGWGDKEGMGISCLVAYVSSQKSFRIFCDDNKEDFQKLLEESDLVVGWNSKCFDDKVVKACWEIEVESFDIRIELMKKVGGASNVSSLGDYGKANFGVGKRGHGADAPILFQRGQIGALLDYCVQDALLTKKLFEEALERDGILNPKTGEVVSLEIPILTEQD